MKIIMLAGKGNSTKYIYNGISSEISVDAVLLSDPLAANKLIQRRIKKLGLFTVINQLLFQVIISKLIGILSKKIIIERKVKLSLIDSPIPKEKLIDVGFVNSKKCIETIKLLNPDVIIVNGTSIISRNVLQSTQAIFINTHVGITPQYRGVHGGYWALRNHDTDNFGVTVHKVDTGIDTGDIVYQNTCVVSKKDNFLTYPLYQYALAIPLLTKTISDIKKGTFKTYRKKKENSKLYYHPTFTDYIYGLLKDGIR